MFISLSFTRMVQRADKASLLTASGMLLHAVPSMFVSSGNRCLQTCSNCFIEYLHRKLLTANFLSYDIESAKKNGELNLRIKSINFLFYNYVFNSSQKMTKDFGTNQLFPLLKYMINRDFGTNQLFPLLKYMINRS